jgi:hypothetical protein
MGHVLKVMEQMHAAARVGKQQIWRAASRQARVNARKATQEYRKSNAGNQQRAESEGPIARTGSVAWFQAFPLYMPLRHAWNPSRTRRWLVLCCHRCYRPGRTRESESLRCSSSDVLLVCYTVPFLPTVRSRWASLIHLLFFLTLSHSSIVYSRRVEPVPVACTIFQEMTRRISGCTTWVAR